MHDAPANSGVPQFRMPPVARVREHYTLLCGAAASQFGARSLAGRLLLVDGLAQEGDGLLIALLAAIPIVNLFAPLFGTALMVHEFKRYTREEQIA